VRIEAVVDASILASGAGLFDDPPGVAASSRFFRAAGHHLLFAFDDDGHPVGFVTGVELVHPDKGVEMYLNELGVAPECRGRGVGGQLVTALMRLAKEVGCYGMWGVTEPDNAGAIATYRHAGADDESSTVLFAWHF